MSCRQAVITRERSKTTSLNSAIPTGVGFAQWKCSRIRLDATALEGAERATLVFYRE